LKLISSIREIVIVVVVVFFLLDIYLIIRKINQKRLNSYFLSLITKAKQSATKRKKVLLEQISLSLFYFHVLVRAKLLNIFR
jgi:hypothetical protein